MKTVQEILDYHFIHGLGTGEDIIEAAFEEYRNQQPDPQPIEKLFDLKEDTDVWIKDNDDEIYLGHCFPAWDDWVVILEVKNLDTFQGESEITHAFKSFIIVETPKF